MKQQKQIRQQAYQSQEGFLRHYQELVKKEVIPYQYAVLTDSLEGVEKSHVIQNFINAGRALRGEDVGDGFYGMVFQDSDLAKWLEAVAYILAVMPDPALEKTADELIELVAGAQDEDGYLDTFFTIKDREKRWQNLAEGHELYCAGHMMEAAVAYYETTGKEKLLRVMEKNAEHIYQKFVTEQTPGYPGHPEVELALMKLYRATGNRHCLELAEHFINTRGEDPAFFEKENAGRNWSVWGNDGKDYEYAQNGKPVRKQEDATGHSVRAVYLYTGMADLASETGDESLLAACRRLWNSIVRRRMYVTGGIGSTVLGEAFTVDYDLPNDTAYAETCASIGLMFFASRMLENEVKGEYGDVMEKALYNTVLAGMQLDGKRFFYVNPLEVIPGVSGVARTHRHVLPERPAWYACACCPPNVARLLASIGKYAYGENENTAFCHLYAAGEAAFDNGLVLNCRTGYPYEFRIQYEVKKGSGRLAIRIPGYSPSFLLLQNGAEAAYELKDGYAYLPEVTAGDQITLQLNDSPYYVYASSRVAADTGKTALCRGPLVYCFEGVDNEGDILSLALKKQGTVTVVEGEKGLSDGEKELPDSAGSLLDSAKSLPDSTKSLPEEVVCLQAEAVRVRKTGELYTMEPPAEEPCKALAVPYYTWGNRGENQMRVWMNYR